MDKNEILNSDCDVRRYAACNLNTSVEVLTKLTKDSDFDVRRYAACNPKLKEVLTDKNKSDED